MDILEAAKHITGVSWNFRNGVFEQADDGSPRIEPPPFSECQALVDRESYKEKRRNEYPPLADQLDALWKGGKDADDMKARIEAVKAKYPKPS